MSDARSVNSPPSSSTLASKDAGSWRVAATKGKGGAGRASGGESGDGGDGGGVAGGRGASDFFSEGMDAPAAPLEARVE